MRATTSILAGIIALFSTACAGGQNANETLVAQDNAVATQVAGIAATATVEADRMRVTLAYVETEVARVQTQQARMIGTLAEFGVDVATMPATLVPPPAMDTTTPPTNPTPAPPGAPTTRPGQVQVTPFTITPPVTATPTPVSVDTTGPALTSVVTAPTVGDDDCAVGSTGQFLTTTPEIYVVALAINIPENTDITSRWLREDTQLWEFGLTFPAIESACIYFFATQEEFEFTPGTYTVELTIDDAPAGTATFTITGQG